MSTRRRAAPSRPLASPLSAAKFECYFAARPGMEIHMEVFLAGVLPTSLGSSSLRLGMPDIVPNVYTAVVPLEMPLGLLLSKSLEEARSDSCLFSRPPPRCVPYISFRPAP